MEYPKFWQGLNVDVWSRIQTRNAKNRGKAAFEWYTGHDPLSYDALDFFEEIPIDIRFASFSSRLDRFAERVVCALHS